MAKNFIIRVAESAEDLRAVFRFRYHIYVEEMQRFQTYADHGQRTIQEPLDKHARILAAFDTDGQVIGTGRVNYSYETSDLGDYEELYGMKELVGGLHPVYTSITTKFMVASAYRHSTLSIRLASAIYSMALYDGVLLDFIDCNPHLEGYFQKLGYRAYRGRIHHLEYGDVMPIVLAVTDIAHLEKIGSPFARAFRAVRAFSGQAKFEKNVAALQPSTFAFNSYGKVVSYVG